MISMTPAFISHHQEAPFDLESREFFLQGTPPNYRMALLYLVGTAETTPKALRAGTWFVLATPAALLPLPQKGLTQTNFPQ